MSRIPVQSRSHSLVKNLRSIRDGEEKYFIFCEGFKVIEELLRSSLNPSEIYCVKEKEESVEKLLKFYQKTSVPLHLLSSDVMEFVSDVDSPPGVIAIARKPREREQPEEPLRKNPFFLIVHRVQLPQNVGSLLRTSEAAGVSEVWLTKGTADPYSPKGIRGSSGSIFRLKIKTEVDLAQGMAELQKKQFSVYTATQNGSKFYDEVDWKGAAALVLGSEGGGFSEDELRLFQNTIRIPMAGKVESLNVGTAAAVCLFEAARQRKEIS